MGYIIKLFIKKLTSDGIAWGYIIKSWIDFHIKYVTYWKPPHHMIYVTQPGNAPDETPAFLRLPLPLPLALKSATHPHLKPRKPPTSPIHNHWPINRKRWTRLLYEKHKQGPCLLKNTSPPFCHQSGTMWNEIWIERILTTFISVLVGRITIVRRHVHAKTKCNISYILKWFGFICLDYPPALSEQWGMNHEPPIIN